MHKSVWRLALVIGTATILAGCGNKETKEALDKSAKLESQKQYYDANNVLMEALTVRESKVRGDNGALPTEQVEIDALRKKVQSDPEILKLERAQIPLYLHLERADMASTVYADILAGHPGDTVVYDALHDKDPVIRAGAVRILGLVGSAEAINALAGVAKDSDQDVRRAAVVALGSIKDPRTVGPLIDALKDSYWDVRSEAANALSQEHDGSAVAPLLEAVSDKDTTVQASAENSLVLLSKDLRTQTKEAASPAADEFARHLDDPNQKVSLVAAVCLALLRDGRSIPVLTKMISSDDAIARLDAVKGLGETGDPSVIPTLRVTLKSTDINMQGWSIIGLGNLKDQGSLADLQALASDTAQPTTIRAAADAAIRKIMGQTSAQTEP